MTTSIATHEIAGREAIEIRGGDYVEFSFGFIYGVGAVATLTGLGLPAVVLAGTTFFLYDLVYGE